MTKKQFKTIKIRCYIEYEPTLDQNGIFLRCNLFSQAVFNKITKKVSFFIAHQGHCLNKFGLVRFL